MQQPTDNDKQASRRPESLTSAIPAGACIYAITITPEGQAHVSLQPAANINPDNDTIALSEIGKRTRANLSAGSAATLLFSPADSSEYTLIVDGAVSLDDKGAVVTPKRAKLHRLVKPAPNDASNVQSACGHDCMGVPLRG